MKAQDSIVQSVSPFCFVCDSDIPNWKVESKKIEQIFRGESFLIEVNVHCCSQCGYERVSDEEQDKLAELTQIAYRERHNLLSPLEIKQIRKTLKQTQTEFSEFLGVGVASVKRWEKGLAQEPKSDHIIRSKTATLTSSFVDVEENSLNCVVRSKSNLRYLKEDILHSSYVDVENDSYVDQGEWIGSIAA